MNEQLQDIPLITIDGKEVSLKDYAGKVILIVNVASKCGLTPQYSSLERFYRHHAEEGLVVLGFPANDFGEQEPGTDQQIADFCKTEYEVTFPLFSKIAVSGPHQHPLYTALVRAKPSTVGEGSMRQRLQDYGIAVNLEPEVLWNFEKFLISREGEVVGRFAPDMDITDTRIQEAIRALL